MSPRIIFPAVVFFSAPSFLGAAVPAAADRALDRAFATTVRPFVETYCTSCHGNEKPEAELDLSPFTTTASVVDGFAHWELVL